MSDKSDLCYISSKTKYSLGLSYVIKYNGKFLMIADTCDYEYDGYVIVKWESIEEVVASLTLILSFPLKQML